MAGGDSTTGHQGEKRHTGFPARKVQPRCERPASPGRARRGPVGILLALDTALPAALASPQDGLARSPQAGTRPHRLLTAGERLSPNGLSCCGLFYPAQCEFGTGGWSSVQALLEGFPSPDVPTGPCHPGWLRPASLGGPSAGSDTAFFSFKTVGARMLFLPVTGL